MEYNDQKIMRKWMFIIAGCFLMVSLACFADYYKCQRCNGTGCAGTKNCSMCNGNRYIDRLHDCPTCNGNGYVRDAYGNQERCPNCYGSKKINERTTCPKCNGTGEECWECPVCHGTKTVYVPE